MDVPPIERGFVSDDLVDYMVLDQRDRLDQANGPSTLGLILCYPDAANRSYGLAALGYAERLAAEREGTTPPIEFYIPTASGDFEVITTAEELREAHRRGIYTPSVAGRGEPDTPEGIRHDSHIVDLVQQLSGAPRISKILPLFRSASGWGDRRIRESVHPDKDADGVSPHRLVPPATPEAQVSLAAHKLGRSISDIKPGKIGVIGRGPLVGKPLLEEVLPAHKVDVGKLGLVLGTTPEIVAGVPGLAEHDLQVLFTAIPVGALLRPQHIRDGTIVIDAGYGTDERTGMPCGNASPELLALNGLRGISVSAFRRGVGIVTVATVFDRTIPPRTPDQSRPRPDRELVVVGR